MNDKVIQIIPAKETLYAVCDGVDGDNNDEKVYYVDLCNYLALCEDGNIVAVISGHEGYFWADTDDNYAVYEKYAYDDWKKNADLRVIECF